MVNFTIKTIEQVKQKLDMLDSLANIEIATEILKKEKRTGRHPADVHYEKMKIDLEAESKESEAFKLCEDYMANTQGRTHSHIKPTLKRVYKVNRHGEREQFKLHEKNENRQLLWHGSRLTNYVGILSQGLRIAPPEAPVSGYMFGKGVYFADMVTKSAQYCGAYKSTGLMLLCEVALGESRPLLNADFNAGKLPDGKLSTLGVGAMQPDPAEMITLPDGVKVPLGKPVDVKKDGGHLQYNEYIVYDVSQIRMRYLLEVEFN
eukprot:GHVN01091096.1.p1 GENE.GHVN01091096.1~~GHVN01091096.1.p1  ORF type:complete len:291 (-),score=46.72 GHVN01091096.1:106-891(-)